MRASAPLNSEADRSSLRKTGRLRSTDRPRPLQKKAPAGGRTGACYATQRKSCRWGVGGDSSQYCHLNAIGLRSFRRELRLPPRAFLDSRVARGFVRRGSGLSGSEFAAARMGGLARVILHGPVPGCAPSHTMTGSVPGIFEPSSRFAQRRHASTARLPSSA